MVEAMLAVSGWFQAPGCRCVLRVYASGQHLHSVACPLHSPTRRIPAPDGDGDPR